MRRFQNYILIFLFYLCPYAAFHQLSTFVNNMDLNRSAISATSGISNLSSLVDNIDFSLNQINISLNEDTEHDDEYSNIIKNVMYFYIRHNITLVCLEDAVRLLNSCAGLQLPTSKPSIMAMFEKNVRIKTHIIYYVKCVNCKTYEKMLKSEKKNCSKCEAALVRTETNFFVYFPVKNQIIEAIRENWETIQNFHNDVNDDYTGSISDVQNASYVVSLKKKINTNRNLISLMMNTDGANKFKSNTLSVWPIQLVLNDLPPQIRYFPKNIIVAGLYYGPTKPDCMEFFFPLVNEMKELQSVGISINLGDDTFDFEPVITHCCVDLPAKRMLQCIKQYNGFNACTYCLHPGMAIPSKNKKLKQIRYPIPTNAVFVYPPRTHKNTLKSMRKKKFENTDDGVVGLSCLVSMPNFDLINSFGIDYMHCVVIGVTRKICDLYFDSKNKKKTFYINKKKQGILNERLLSIKPNREVMRLPRSLTQLAKFKASETRSILLFYFPICLIKILPAEYVTHFRRLSSAIYKLLKPTISEVELEEVHRNLTSFVTDFQDYFGLKNMVMNVHLLTHIVESVKCLGPLWSHSAFPFERNNGCLLKFVNGTTDVLDQIASKYGIWKNIEVPNKKITHNNFMGKAKRLKIKEAEEFISIISDERIKFENTEISAFSRFKKNGIVYTSLMYKKIRTIDYFVRLQNGDIGTIKYYAYIKGQKCAFIEEYEILETIDHIFEVEPSGIDLYAPVDLITDKYLYMYVEKRHYITIIPNVYEKE